MRIDKLVPGTYVTLGFTYGNEPAVFLGILGEGTDRLAQFAQVAQGTKISIAAEMFAWEAYRYNGRWVYGTSAEPLKLVGLLG